MKVIALGDTHGRRNWQSIVNKNQDADKIIFIGDYFDTHENVSPLQQQENFKDIIGFKKAFPDKVILLIGNHDFHYLPTSKMQYSGYQKGAATAIQWLLKEALDENLLQACFVYDKYIFVHAGITKTWCIYNGIDMINAENHINKLFRAKPNQFEFTMGSSYSPYGDDITQTPIWVRPKSLYMDKIPNYIQVVGHTTQDKISGLNGSRKVYTQGQMIETSGVIFIDTLGTSGEYLTIIDGVPKATL